MKSLELIRIGSDGWAFKNLHVLYVYHVPTTDPYQASLTLMLDTEWRGWIGWMMIVAHRVLLYVVALEHSGGRRFHNSKDILLF